MADDKKKKPAAKKPAASKTTKKAPAKKPVKKVAAKPVAKKTPVKSAPAKKSVAPKTSTKPVAKKSAGSMSFGLAAVLVFLSALLIGNFSADMFQSFDIGAVNQFQKGGKTFIAVENIEENLALKFEEGKDVIVAGGKTWVSVPGKPVELIVVTDKTCGVACDFRQPVASLRQGITPALLTRIVDVDSEEGEDFVRQFDLAGLPSFIFGESVTSVEVAGKKFVEQATEVLTEIRGKYLIDSTKVGFKYGKFIEAPNFETRNEPTMGDGKVTVVEFSDFQCPYCKRLHDQNKDLVKRLVAEGKIEYIVKDFPLGFHAEAPAMHAAANCVYDEFGNDKYFEFVEQIFANQAEWSGKAGQEKAFAQKYADTVGANYDGFTTCMIDSDVRGEISADITVGAKYGVRGTPALFIGTQIMPGAIGPQQFEAAVIAELGIDPVEPKVVIETEAPVIEVEVEETEE